MTNPISVLVFVHVEQANECKHERCSGILRTPWDRIHNSVTSLFAVVLSAAFSDFPALPGYRRTGFIYSQSTFLQPHESKAVLTSLLLLDSPESTFSPASSQPLSRSAHASPTELNPFLSLIPFL